LIGGTSVGGLVATCLGIKHYSLDQLRLLQERLCFDIFAHGQNSATSGGFSKRINNFSQMLRHGSFYSTKALEDLYQTLCQDELLIDTTMETDIKVFVVSTLANAFPPQIYLWRNYQYPVDGQKSRYLGSMNNKVWEALRATSCAPTFFDEFAVGNEKHQDGGCIANNPTAIAVHEAKCLWPHKKIDCIVSLGTGMVPARESQSGFLERTVVEMIECATSVERIHDLMQDTYSDDVYFRFNPIDERFACDLDESHKEKLDEMREATWAFIGKQDQRFSELAKILLGDVQEASPQ